MSDAAERLLSEPNLHRDGWVHAPADDVRAALAAEFERGLEAGARISGREHRRATVERIRAAVDDQLLEAATLGGDFLDSVITWRDLTAILDKEAER